MSLRETLTRIQESLAKRDAVRQDVQTAVRKVTRQAKQAIFQVHSGKLEEAENTLNEAYNLLASLSDLAKESPDLLYSGTVDSAFEEYAEAQIFLHLAKEKRFVGFEEIEVPMIPYVLGLADVIGELRRRALDSMRKNENKKAVHMLELMETIYVELTNLDEIQFLVPGLRRKCDVARRVIEATRGDVTVDVRRSQLENSIRELKRTLEARRKHGSSFS